MSKIWQKSVDFDTQKSVDFDTFLTFMTFLTFRQFWPNPHCFTVKTALKEIPLFLARKWLENGQNAWKMSKMTGKVAKWRTRTHTTGYHKGPHRVPVPPLPGYHHYWLHVRLHAHCPAAWSHRVRTGSPGFFRIQSEAQNTDLSKTTTFLIGQKPLFKTGQNAKTDRLRGWKFPFLTKMAILTVFDCFWRKWRFWRFLTVFGGFYCSGNVRFSLGLWEFYRIIKKMSKKCHFRHFPSKCHRQTWCLRIVTFLTLFD